MRFQRSDIFVSKKPNLLRQQNSSLSSPFQSGHLKTLHEGQLYKILTYKSDEPTSKQRVQNRCNLVIEYIPEFVMVSQTSQGFTVKIKQYSLDLLPWLIKKDALFKVNIVLGIYIAFMELIDIYGIFPLHPNMMKVSERQQVAVWISKNFEVLEPDQVLTKNDFSAREFVKSFLRIFRCCLPNRSTNEMYSDLKQLLNDLVKIKRKEEMHKNCHQFIKHNSRLGSSRKSKNRYQSTSLVQQLKQSQQEQRYSTKPNFQSSKDFVKSDVRFSSFSPPQRVERVKTSIEKINQTAEFKRKSNASFGGNNFFKKKNSILQNQKSDTIKTSISIEPSLCSSGQLFKRYLMFSTSKYQQMNKTQAQPVFHTSSKDRSSKNFIFRSEVYKQNQSAFSQMVVEERNSVQVMSQHIFGLDEEKFTPVKFRKMSSNTNEKPKEIEGAKKFMNSTGWKKSFHQQQNYFFSPTQNDENTKIQPKQKLKNSFPYKTASTINSFRLSNQHQYHIFPSKSEENLNNCQAQSNTAIQQKQKDKKIEEMKIVEQNELENDFNNIFSMQNSNFMKEEKEKQLDMIITEFEGVIF